MTETLGLGQSPDPQPLETDVHTLFKPAPDSPAFTPLMVGTLAIAGTVLVGVGGSLLFTPVQFEASAGIVLPADPSLLSEVRAPGGALLLLGVLMLGSVAWHRMRYTTTVMGACGYLAYGISRLLGMALDGLPARTLVAVTALELIVGASLAWVAWRARR